MSDTPNTPPSVSVVIPLYNEHGNVEGVGAGLLDAFAEASIDLELVLVNNGSNDDTPEVIDALAKADSRVAPVHLAVNQGYGGGILAGLKAAKGDVLGYTWGDNQIWPDDHVKVYRKLCDEGLDLCKSARIERFDGIWRKIVTTIYNGIMRAAFGKLGTRDTNGCPKLMRRSAFEALDIRATDWFIDPEIMLKVKRLGLRYGEVPVIFHAREKGRSNVKLATIVEFIMNIIRARLVGAYREADETRDI